MAAPTKKIPRNLVFAFVAAILFPCGIVVFFGTRAVQMETGFARSSREERLKRVADLLSRQIHHELSSLRSRAEAALWPYREPEYDGEAAESAVVNFARGEALVRCGVVFDAKGRVHGPALSLPFRLSAPGMGPPGGEREVLEFPPPASVELTESEYLRRLLLRKKLRETLKEKGKDPLMVLKNLRDIVKEAGGDDTGAIALYHEARIRLALGDAREAASLAENFVTRNLAGPPEKGLPLRGAMFLLWAEAWDKEGSPGRALQILFWFWGEILEVPNRYDLDLGTFTRVEETLADTVRSVISRGPPDPRQWKERLRKFEEKGRAYRERAEERSLLAREVLPQVSGEGPGPGGARFRAFLLKDRLEVFLYLSPASFELGLPGLERRGAGFRMDIRFLGTDILLPLVRALSSREAEVRILDHAGRGPGGGSLLKDPLTWPLPEPLQAWRVAVSPGDVDPEGRAARSRMIFHAFLVAWAVLAVVGAGWLMTRSYWRATQLASLRSEFVSTVTHDLKTPLTSIRTFTETLQMDRLKDPRRIREYYGFIADEVERLERLIDNILEFARIEAGRREYHLLSLDLHGLMEEWIESFRPSAIAAGFEVEASIDPVPPVLGDVEAIRRALWNLLSNAVKFSLERKWIGIRLHREGETAVIEVSDGGIGISPKDQARIFEKFFRGGSAGGGGRSGTGLGLALVQHVARGHNGGVDVKSAPGKGSHFRFWIPLAEKRPGCGSQGERIAGNRRSSAGPGSVRSNGADSGHRG